MYICLTKVEVPPKAEFTTGGKQSLTKIIKPKLYQEERKIKKKKKMKSTNFNYDARNLLLAIHPNHLFDGEILIFYLICFHTFQKTFGDNCFLAHSESAYSG